ncbi:MULTISPECIES: hypothetical protein [unclassified Rhodococcus (in: high G+C Gram-positive bacteria)]|uniref:hypothetical protein n=1 Tax=unclassified Rhodococcus (in: high G+C Gram-positive bacteria) TaxID=192944 RepID=UPI0015C60E93|nr:MULTISPECIES: hypothetical protein [unclassified Rhodococcus (in: high G+C Gram-positive bacteria)]
MLLDYSRFQNQSVGCGIGYVRALVIKDFPITRAALPQRHPAGGSAALLENVGQQIRIRGNFSELEFTGCPVDIELPGGVGCVSLFENGPDVLAVVSPARRTDLTETHVRQAIEILTRDAELTAMENRLSSFELLEHRILVEHRIARRASADGPQ